MCSKKEGSAHSGPPTRPDLCLQSTARPDLLGPSPHDKSSLAHSPFPSRRRTSAPADGDATPRVRLACSVYPSSPRHSFYPAGFAPPPRYRAQQSVAAVSPTSSPSRTSGAFAAPATDAGNTGERFCGGNSERPASES